MNNIEENETLLKIYKIAGRRFSKSVALYPEWRKLKHVRLGKKIYILRKTDLDGILIQENDKLYFPDSMCVASIKLIQKGKRGCEFTIPKYLCGVIGINKNTTFLVSSIKGYDGLIYKIINK